MELFEQIRREYEFGSRDDPGCGEEVRGASADGAAGDGERSAAPAQGCRAVAAQAGTGGGVHRRDSGSRPAGAAQAAAYGASHLGADWRESDPRSSDR